MGDIRLSGFCCLPRRNGKRLFDGRCNHGKGIFRARKLNVECEKGALTAEDGTTIPYTIEVGITGDGDIDSPSGFGTEPQPIWWYEVPTEYEDPDNLMTVITAAITITLTVEPPYAGTFTDTLTFSVTLETEE